MAIATLVYHDKMTLSDGSVIEMKIWRVPVRSTERPHGLKYSLYYGRGGRRIVGYDNEVGKGDHRHYRGKERPYTFIDIETLIGDFLTDVRRERGQSCAESKSMSTSAA